MSDAKGETGAEGEQELARMAFKTYAAKAASADTGAALMRWGYYIASVFIIGACFANANKLQQFSVGMMITGIVLFVLGMVIFLAGDQARRESTKKMFVNKLIDLRTRYRYNTRTRLRPAPGARRRRAHVDDLRVKNEDRNKAARALMSSPPGSP